METPYARWATLSDVEVVYVGSGRFLVRFGRITAVESGEIGSYLRRVSPRLNHAGEDEYEITNNNFPGSRYVEKAPI